MYIESLLGNIKDYSPKEKELILRAYEFASVVHKGVTRKSGEDYITHPVAVATILAEMHADADTIAAGLLHDTIEDGDGINVEVLSKAFNPTIAFLVDGVTKVLDRDNKTDAEEGKRKIIESILYDIRIIIIKLADRLHNMRTLEYHSKEKQFKIAYETLNMYVPFARLIGEFAFKLELEDLSFKYLNFEEYNKMKYLLNDKMISSRRNLDEVIVTVSQMLNSNSVPFDIKLKVKNIYSLYKKLKKHNDVKEIHDLFELKILVDDVDLCYEVRNYLSKLFKFNLEKSKDYIYLPKTNMYSAIHESTLFKNETPIQFQIKTPEMYMIDQYGLTAYWDLYQNYQNIRMQDSVAELPFYQTISSISGLNLPTSTFNEEIEKNVLGDKVYVSLNGIVIEIPSYYSLYVLLKKYNYDFDNIEVLLNNQKVDLNVELKNKDVIKIKKR